MANKYEVSIHKDISSKGSHTSSEHDNFSYYLAGLIEGDGYLSINNKNNLLIGITFHIHSRPLADLIKGLFKGYLV